MDEIIREIIEIDRKAREIDNNTSKHIENGEKEAKGNIKAMKAEIISNARAEAEGMYDSAIKDINQEAAKIKEASETECEELEYKFLKIKDHIEQKILNELLSLKMGEENEQNGKV